MNPWVLAFSAVPLLLLWGMHQAGWDEPVVKAVCSLAAFISLGHWRPNPDHVDSTGALVAAGAGLSLITLAIGLLFP